MTRKIWKCMIAVSLFTATTVVSLPAVGQSKPVVVVNGPGQPVPTAAQGTTNVAGTVNVGNTPSVTVANTPSVTVANTPSVNVTNTPTVNLAAGGSVTVANTASTPVFVRDDNAARNPF